MNARPIGPVVLAGLICAGPPAWSAGPTGHLRIGDAAIAHLDDASLQELLSAGWPDWYKAGLSFPDAVSVHRNVDINFSHHSDFLTAYARHVRGVCPVASTSLANLSTRCRQMVAHFMGTLGHVVGDHRFDRYFMTRVEQERCFLDGEGRPDRGRTQSFTDGVMDIAVSDTRTDVRPRRFSVLDWLFGRIVAEVPDDIYQPLGLSALNMPAVRSVILGFRGVVVNQPLAAADGRRRVRNVFDCPWPIDVDATDPLGRRNYETAAGGVEDAGRVLADYLNLAWRYLRETEGNGPRFRIGGCYGWPHNDLVVSPTSTRSFGVRPADFAAWIRVAGGVSAFRLQSSSFGERIGMLAGGRLLVREGPFAADARVNPVAPVQLAVGVTGFQLEGDRIAALIDGPPGGLGSPGTARGGVLLVREGPLSSNWVTVASDVLGFRLQGRRIAIVVPDRHQGRRLMLQDGALDSPFAVLTYGDIVDLRLSAERGAVLCDLSTHANTRHKLYAAEALTPGTEWQRVFEGRVTQFELEDDRIGVLSEGELLTRAGPLDGHWEARASGVARFELAGPRTVALDAASGELSLLGVRALVPGGIVDFDFVEASELDRFYAIGAQGAPVAFCNALDGVPEQGAVTRVRMNPRRVGALIDGTLYVKSTDHGDPLGDAPDPGPGVDLGVAMETSVTARVGDSLDYAIQVRNGAASATATGVLAQLYLAPEVSFVGATGADCDFDAFLTCELGEMAPGARVGFSVTVTVDQPGTLPAVVNVVSAEGFDIEPGNNNVSVSTEAAAATLARAGQPAPAGSGGASAVTFVALWWLGVLVGAARRRRAAVR